jgi:regulator of sigma E protease
MVTICSAILAIILTLLLVVGIHEAGHAIAAHFFQVKIKRFSIGFGKPLFIFQKGAGIEWVVARWPLGGYVLLLNSRIEPVPEQDYPLCFDKKSIVIRIVILLAGAMANFLTAWIALILVFSIGLSEVIPEVKIVEANTIAAKAGLKSGDHFIAIANHNTVTWREINMQLLMALGKSAVPITIKNKTGELQTLTVDMRKSFYRNKRQSLLKNMGIIPLLTKPLVKLQATSLMDAIYKANHFILDTVIFMTMVIKQLLTGMIGFSQLLGPFGLLALTATSLLQGIGMFLFFIAGFSIAVGFVNLFPLPSLDGGSILYACIEKIRGKPISVAWEVLLHQLTIIALAVLLMNLIGNDLQSFARS